MRLDWIDRLWERLVSRYGSRFTDMWRGIDPDKLKQAWSEEMAGYTADELRRGLEACKAKDWPPTLPEFLKLCRPPMNYEAAYREAQLNIVKIERNEQPEWSSRAVYWAKVQYGHFDLKNSDYSSARKRWAEILDELIATDKERGLPEIPVQDYKQLVAPGKTQISREEAAKRVKELGIGLVGKVAIGLVGRKDHKAWARAILADPKNRPQIAIQFATEALGIVDQPQETTA